jgi:ribonuclease P protein component
LYLRLKKNSDFKKLYSAGKKSFQNGIIMIYSPAISLKMGISVSKKHGGSVQRNRLKRLIRAAFYDLSKNINGNFNIVFIPKADFNHTYNNLKESIYKMLSKEGLLEK